MNWKNSTLLIAAAWVILLAGCGSQQLVIKGTVKTPDDKPAVAANVRTEPRSESVTTFEDGSFEIENKLSEGWYSVIATYAEQEGRLDSVTVPNDTPITIFIGKEEMFDPEPVGPQRDPDGKHGDPYSGQ